MHNQLPFLYGKPTTQGVLKQSPEDFVVREQIKVAHTGEGEHLWLNLRKRGMNTQFLADRLADWAGVAKRDVAYAGMKDRHAVTDQWFSLQLPGRTNPDFNTLQLDGVELLDAVRHEQKIRPAVIAENRFVLTLRDIRDGEALTERWQVICEQGGPNYFGEQRFGHGGGNLDKARAMFAGKRIRSKHQRGLYLSAARSYLYNLLLAQRIEDGTLLEPLSGDCMMLAGSRSFFPYDGAQETLRRLQQGDLAIALPLWGEGQDKLSPELLARCQMALAEQAELTSGLENARVKLAFRPTLLQPKAPELRLDADVMTIDFSLPAGAFATTLLRELVDYQQASPTE